MAPLSAIATPLLSAGVAATGALMVLPLSTSAPMASPSAILVAMASPSSFSHARISLDNLYTSSDAHSLWGVSYKSEQKTSIGFVSTFNKNLISRLGCKMLLTLPKFFSKGV